MFNGLCFPCTRCTLKEKLVYSYAMLYSLNNT